MNFKKIFVTVGTTEFNDLIERLSEQELLNVLKNLGCQQLKLQIGRGLKVEFKKFEGIDVEMFDLKPSIVDDIEEADLVGRSNVYNFFFNSVIFSDNKPRWSRNLHRRTQPWEAINCCR